MDALIVVPLILVLFFLHYYFTDHDTVIDKDRKRFAEGIALFESGNTTAAHAYFDQKVKENRKSALAYSYRGKCNLQDGNLYSALYDFTEALSFDNTLVEVHLDKGRVHFQLEEYKEAFLSFDKAVWFSRGSVADALHWRTEAHQKLPPSTVADKGQEL